MTKNKDIPPVESYGLYHYREPECARPKPLDLLGFLDNGSEPFIDDERHAFCSKLTSPQYGQPTTIFDDIEDDSERSGTLRTYDLETDLDNTTGMFRFLETIYFQRPFELVQHSLPIHAWDFIRDLGNILELKKPLLGHHIRAAGVHLKTKSSSRPFPEGAVYIGLAKRLKGQGEHWRNQGFSTHYQPRNTLEVTGPEGKLCSYHGKRIYVDAYQVDTFLHNFEI